MNSEVINGVIKREASQNVQRQRALVDQSIRGQRDLLIVGQGQCSFTAEHQLQTDLEAREMSALNMNQSEALFIQRRNYWKPRSNPNAWHGIDSVDPEHAMNLHQEALCRGFALCGELALSEHIDRYANGYSFGWTGSRNSDTEFLIELAVVERTMPLAIKNGLDGSLGRAFEKTKLANVVRTNTGGGALAFLLHRGGNGLRTPEKWSESIKETLEMTGGEMGVDFAHGAEQAHDPEGNFSKTIEGQIRAMEHYQRICEKLGIWARMLLIEASDAPSETDPNMPHQIAIEGVKAITSAQFSSRL